MTTTTTTATTTTTKSLPVMEALLSDKSRLRSASASTTDSTATAVPFSIVTSTQTDRPTTRHPPLNTTFLGIPHPRFKESVVQFLGIKYAHVTTRWRQARLWTTFEGMTDAGKYGPTCPQPTLPAQTPEELMFGSCPPDLASTHYPLPAQDEFECLNLNITAPKGLNPHARLPVMVWVHGGGHRGSGSEWYYDPGSIVEKSIESEQPVIWVTINFRIGLLGWATCPSIRDDTKAAGDEGAANFGLHDQRKALEWIHYHIAPFGGDPHNITLIGAGTGAADIVYHLLSKKNGDSGVASPYCPFASANPSSCNTPCHHCEEVDPSTAPGLIEVIEEEDGTKALPSILPTVHSHASHPHYPYRLFERAILQSPIFETVLADVNTAGWHLQRIMGAIGLTGYGGVNSTEGLERLRGVEASKIVNLGYVPPNSSARTAAAAASAAAAATSLRVVDDGCWFREGWQAFFQKEGGWNGRSGPVVSRHGHGTRFSKSKSRSRSRAGRSAERSVTREGRNVSKTRNSGRSTSRNPRSMTRRDESGAHPMPFNISKAYEDPNKDNVAGVFPGGAFGCRCASCGVECAECMRTAAPDRAASMYAHPREARSVVHASSADYYSSNLESTLGTMKTNTSNDSMVTNASMSSDDSLHVRIEEPLHNVHPHYTCSHPSRFVCNHHSPYVYAPGHHSHSHDTCSHPHTRSRSHHKRIKTPFAMLQPIIIGDSPADALLWAHPISYWTATGVVRRLKAICASAGGATSYTYSAAAASAASTPSANAGGGVSSYLASSSSSPSYGSYGGATSSLGLSTNLLRAYELSSYVEDDEVGERVGEIVQDARIGWGVELVDRGVRRERGGADISSGHGGFGLGGGSVAGSETGGVWRYVFDQEGFGIGGPEQGDGASQVPGGGLRGSPHYAADLVYLFDHTPVVPPEEDEEEMMMVDDVHEPEVLPPGSGTPTTTHSLSSGMHGGKTKSRTRSQTHTTNMLSPGAFAEDQWAETFDVDSDSEDEAHPINPEFGDAKGGREEEPVSIASLVVSQLNEKLEAHMDCGGSSVEFSSSMASLTTTTTTSFNNLPSHSGSTATQGVTSNAWLETPITPYTYNRVSCTLLDKWLRFSYGIAPWNDTKVFVFGPEGEVGERSREIFEARRRVKVWEDVLGPLGWATVLKVGVELSRGPVGGA